VPKGRENDDADTWRFALRSLMQIINTLGLHSIDPSIANKSLEVFFEALNDYAVDKRGDVGSWVRE
jgi:hypothetical protein